MTFTIKCDNCGNEQKFEDYKSTWDKIKMNVITSPDGWEGTNIDEIEVHCENPKCENYITIEYW